ncbi:unnamed protein product [Pedinophyceae sp. YPF-701]|nr:unnamed protein product [Pedinophyceae sp. YPF-701]
MSGLELGVARVPPVRASQHCRWCVPSHTRPLRRNLPSLEHRRAQVWTEAASTERSAAPSDAEAPSPSHSQPRLARGTIRVLAETEEYLVIDKPAGLSFHRKIGEHSADGEEQDGTLQAVRRAQREGLLLGSAYQGRLHSVHRLDEPTSGALLFAKSSEAAGTASALFRDHSVVKYYVAISQRRPKKKQGTVKGGMRRSRRGGWMLTRAVKGADNVAVTRFRSWSIAGLGAGMRAYVLRPETGRTHQLRVAMKSLGAPIAGDKAYGTGNGDRLYLHAAALRVPLGPKGAGVLEVVSVPTDGTYFASAAFREEWWEEVFLPQVRRTGGVWFADDPLLRSEGRSDASTERAE